MNGFIYYQDHSTESPLHSAQILSKKTHSDVLRKLQFSLLTSVRMRKEFPDRHSRQTFQTGLNQMKDSGCVKTRFGCNLGTVEFSTDCTYAII